MSLLSLHRSISKTERRFLLGLALLVMAVTTAPLVAGWLWAPEGKVFTGVQFIAPNDWFVYYSYLEQARQGHWLFQDLFASQPQQPQLHPFWLLVGLTSRWLGLSSGIALNAARLILIPIALYVSYLCITKLFTAVRERKLAMLVFTFGSGLGVLFSYRIVQFPNNFANGQFNWPLDLWVPEAFTFLTLQYSPHFIAALILILAIMLLTMLQAETGRYRYSWLAGLSALALFSFHPFHYLSVFSVLAVFTIWRIIQAGKLFGPAFSHFVTVVVCALPPAVYYQYLIATDFVTRTRAAQNLTPTTPLWLTVVSYGLLLGLALVGLWSVQRKKLPIAWQLILLWLPVHFAAIYFPVAYQRRMSAGLQFPMAMLATVGLLWLGQRYQKQGVARTLAVTVIAGLLIFSNVFALAVDVFIYRDARTLTYVAQDEVAAARWLATTPAGSVTFNSANRIINILPAYSGRPVYSGHGVETPFFGMTELEVEKFFARDRDSEQERRYLLKQGIDYLYYGPLERQLGSYDPSIKEYLEKVFENTSVEIYQVVRKGSQN